MKNKRFYGNLMLILTALIWGSSFVAQSVGMDYIGPFTFNAIRCIIGGIVLIPIILVMDKVKKESKTKNNNKQLILGGILCGIALFIGSTFQQFGISFTSVGKAGFITALYIVLVPLLGILFKKKVSLKIWLSVFISLIGLYLLCITENFSIGKGDLLVLFCAFFFAIHILLIDYFSPKVNGVKMSCIQFFVAGIISVFPMAIFESPTLASILLAWAPILYAGVLSCGVAYTLQVVAQKNTDPTVASLLLSLESVFAVISGWFILGESLSLKELIGCILVFIAIILAQLPNKNKIL
ncbi:putative membrane protein [Clostridium bornimense]|uniref:Putative membrane protein n=1 Tax=Clostridium bornimense TaxID=1216932 RepID=W6SK51_9CLOT|nr:DMT family transporter [Clostridium bornimense]CDM70185.1 putative membrane protein [Clostridium bornimense]